jgi:NAD(P)-dependent dehydrogenase (short-subunit alcohol dehydrogenase family)
MTWRRAAIVGASGGIGGGLAAALREAGTEVIALSRPELDLEDEASVERAAGALRSGEPIDLAIVATGILAPSGQGPEKALRDLRAGSFAKVLAVNTIGPLIAAKHFVPLLPRTGRSAFAVLGARVGSIADNRLGGWYSYRASKAALAMAVRTLAIEVARSRPEAVVCALHPGTVDTALSRPFQSAVSDGRLFAPELAARHLLSVLADLTPADSGGHFAWDGTPVPA